MGLALRQGYFSFDLSFCTFLALKVSILPLKFTEIRESS